MDCKGDDRSNMCRLCGSKEHMDKERQSPPYCVICAKGNEKMGRSIYWAVPSVNPSGESAARHVNDSIPANKLGTWS